GTYLCTGSAPSEAGGDCQKEREACTADDSGRRNGAEKKIKKRKMFCSWGQASSLFYGHKVRNVRYLFPVHSAGNGLSPGMSLCLSGQYAVLFHIPGDSGMFRTGCFSVRSAFLFLL